STTPLFYLEMLWEHDRILLLLSGAGLLFALLKRDVLLPVWVVATLLPYSLAASRFDYYALLAYPALALLAGRLVVEGVPRLAPLFASAVLLASFLHLTPRIGRPVPGDVEVGSLARFVQAISRPDDPLLVVGQYPFSARFYSQRNVLEVLD